VAVGKAGAIEGNDGHDNKAGAVGRCAIIGERTGPGRLQGVAEVG
jgi:hypothetical protein